MNETFGSSLRKYRRKSGLSQRELAKRIKRDFSYISKLENDRLPPPSADTIVAICNTLEIEPNRLLALSGKIPGKIHETVGKNEQAQRFLQEAQKLGLTDSDWESLTKSLKSLRKR